MATLGVNVVPLKLSHETETLRVVVYFAGSVSPTMLAEEQSRVKLSTAASAADLFEMTPFQMLP